MPQPCALQVVVVQPLSLELVTLGSGSAKSDTQFMFFSMLSAKKGISLFRWVVRGVVKLKLNWIIFLPTSGHSCERALKKLILYSSKGAAYSLSRIFPNALCASLAYHLYVLNCFFPILRPRWLHSARVLKSPVFLAMSLCKLWKFLNHCHGNPQMFSLCNPKYERGGRKEGGAVMGERKF